MRISDWSSDVCSSDLAAESSLPKTRTTRLSQLLLINGPNLNLLGSREPEVYGRQTLADIETALASDAAQPGHQLSCFQSIHEGALVDHVQPARNDGTALILLHPGAYTHHILALRYSLLSVSAPILDLTILRQ